MDATRLPVVDIARCTACGDCVDACPKGLFSIMPMDHKLFVQCRSALEGDEVLALCAVGCTACGKCALDAAAGLITMRNGLPVIDYANNALASPAAARRCATGAIVWIDGAQRFEQATRADLTGALT
jgi:ferredoxin